MYYTSRETYEFVSKQTNDPIVEWKTCKVSGQPFPIYQSDLEFYKKISPTFNGVKFQIPTPTLCPEERARKRLSFRNERHLYRRACDASGKSLITTYSPDKPYKVYDQKLWRGDSRNPLDYGIAFNPAQSFSQHFSSLLTNVPRPSLISANAENAEYINLTADAKNCYMVIESSNVENCLYSYRLQRCTNCVDCNFSESCEVCYEIDNCFRCYKCFYSQSLNDCSDCRYCNTCEHCSFCFGCANLQNQSYCIYNKQVSKEEFEQYMKSHVTNEYQTIRNQYPEIKNQVRRSERSYGNYLTNTKNCVFCYHGYDAEDCKYGEHVLRNVKDCRDVSTVGRDASLIYESINTAINVSNNAFCNTCRDSHDIWYSDLCFYSDHLFGCVGLRNQSYCIFNKQYEKAEYETLIPQLIKKMHSDGEWGEFFHPSLSPFGYNETVAQESFPLEKTDLPAQHGYKRSDYSSDPKIPDNAELLHPATLPDDQRKALVNDDSILKKIIICAESGRPFIIQRLELDFYRKMGLPLPKLHPDLRHAEKMKLRQNKLFYSE
ncbi:MAG: hypothetical protein LBG59_04260 [Candidatus Peribacteria bacterium]|jgi:hypothetical protein|nr:hypothetical protein [Candidatus Peribacteria bacterium]